MSLYIQFQSFVVSFLYGLFFSLMFNLLYFFLFTKYKFINIITNLFFTLIMFGVYYLLLYIVNGGNIHVYFLITFFISFYLYNKIFVKLRVKWLKIKGN